MNRLSQNGQGLVEFVLVLGVMSILITTALEHINQSLNQQHVYISEMRSALFQPLPQQSWQSHQHDEFSRRVSSFSSSFEHLVDVDFPTQNLKSVSHEQSPYMLARLTHAWQAETELALRERPAKLTATYHLHELGLKAALDVVGVVPLAEELNSKSLQLGWVDADAVPPEALCGDKQCQ